MDPKLCNHATTRLVREGGSLADKCTACGTIVRVFRR